MLRSEAVRLFCNRSFSHEHYHTQDLPLRQRMIEDMRIRKLEPKTQSGYIRAVRDFTVWFGRSPDRAAPEDLRLFQLHLVDKGVSPISINAMQSGLRFFFDITLNRPEVTATCARARRPASAGRTQPRGSHALDRGHTQHQVSSALSVAYGAGLRASEVIGLKVSDVDSKRHVLRIEQGKGHKDRYALLPPILLKRLRGWWRHARAEGKVLPTAGYFRGSIRCSHEYPATEPRRARGRHGCAH